MKIIIDANCCHKLTASNADGLPVLKRLLCGKLMLCLSETLRREIALTPLIDIYKELVLAGFVTEFDGGVDAEANSINPNCKSNDSHIVALARISKCRLLFSQDKPLHSDFTNLKLVPSPKGKVYQNRKHEHLLP
jgi:hypothetical protein